MGEHRPYKPGVAGSSPVPPTKKMKTGRVFWPGRFYLPPQAKQVPYPRFPGLLDPLNFFRQGICGPSNSLGSFIPLKVDEQIDPAAPFLTKILFAPWLFGSRLVCSTSGTQRWTLSVRQLGGLIKRLTWPVMFKPPFEHLGSMLDPGCGGPAKNVPSGCCKSQSRSQVLFAGLFRFQTH